MSDEIFQTAFKEEEGKLYKILTQPTEDLILERNKELRKNPGALEDRGALGRLEASVPFNVFEKWRREYPDLTQGDGKQRGNRMQWLLHNTELGRACLLRDKTAKSATKYHEVLV